MNTYNNIDLDSHAGPRIIDNPATMQWCSNEPDCILLICLPPSILALIDMKHSLKLVILLLINCAALFTSQLPALSISKRRLGGRSCRLTLIGFSFADSEHQDGSSVIIWPITASILAWYINLVFHQVSSTVLYCRM